MPRGRWSTYPNFADFCPNGEASPEDIQLLFQQYQQFSKLSNRMIDKGLESPDDRIKFISLLVVGDRGMPRYDDCFFLLKHENPMVRQASRRALVALAADHLQGNKNWRTGKTPPKFVDFGPPPACTKEQAKGAEELWREWWEERTEIENEQYEKKKAERQKAEKK